MAGEDDATPRADEPRPSPPLGPAPHDAVTGPPGAAPRDGAAELSGPPSHAGPPPYGYPTYALVPVGYGPAGYPIDPATGQPWSDRSRTTAGLLQLLLPFVGICGVGRLYAGNIGIGLAQLLGFFLGVVTIFILIGFVIVPAVWLWTFVDGIVLLSAGGTDGTGRRLR